MTQWFGRMKPWFLTETCLNIKSESCPCLCGPSRSIPAFTLIEPPGSYFERRRPEKLSGRRVSAMDVQGCVRQPQPHSESPTSRHSLPGCPAIPTAQTDGQPPGPAGRHVRRPSRPPDRASSGVSSHGLRVYWELKDAQWMGTVVLGHSRRHPQPSCPAMPTAQVDGQPPAPSRPESR